MPAPAPVPACRCIESELRPLRSARSGSDDILIFSYVSYQRLTAEQRVADLEFRRINPEEFQARMMVAGQEDRFFVLRGG